MSEEVLNKPEALRLVLEKHGLEIDPEVSGNKKYSCPYPDHAHGDRNKSFSVNYSEGLARCFTCDRAGDAIELLRIHEGMPYRDAVATANGLVEEYGGGVSPATQRYSPSVFGVSRTARRERRSGGHVPSWQR